MGLAIFGAGNVKTPTLGCEKLEHPTDSRQYQSISTHYTHRSSLHEVSRKICNEFTIGKSGVKKICDKLFGASSEVLRARTEWPGVDLAYISEEFQPARIFFWAEWRDRYWRDFPFFPQFFLSHVRLWKCWMCSGWLASGKPNYERFSLFNLLFLISANRSVEH